MSFLGLLWFIFQFLFVLSIVIQYVCTIVTFLEKKFNTKKDFFLFLIPCYPHMLAIREFWKTTKETCKDAWSSLK